MPAEPTILVTGAGGFIGGRVVEVLQQRPGVVVRPAVRRWSTAARIGRLPLDALQCDLLDAAQVRAAMAGVDVVIHCAVGDRQVIVDGTRNLLAAAREAKVRRVVHVSTIDVYGRSDGRVDESHPMIRTDRVYGDSKIEAEQVCAEFVAKGLDVVIIRPSIVYGPFSELWTVEFALRFRDASWLLPKEACQGRCNLVYVDDVVQGALLAMDAPGVSGEAFNVNGPDVVTWQQYFEALNTALVLPPLPSPPQAQARATSAITDPIKSLVKTTYKANEELILSIYKKSKPARVMMKWLERTLRKVPNASEFDLFGRVVHFPTDKAEQKLGYRPAVDMARGVRLSALWLLHEGVVETRGA